MNPILRNLLFRKWIYKNLFNKNTVADGYYLYNTSNAIVPDADWAYSDYIPVTQFTQYTKTSDHGALYYNSNKEYIGYSTGFTFTTIENAAYTRVNIYKPLFPLEYYQVEVGGNQTFYEPYKF